MQHAGPESETPSRKISLRYLGFEGSEEGRWYYFDACQFGQPSRQFSVLVRSDAFAGVNRIRFQEAAQICFRKLAADLAAEGPDTPVDAQCVLSDEAIVHFRDAPTGYGSRTSRKTSGSSG
ncbi:MAG: hypothetical protein HY652_06595 [Acidobacteria bacterium]|nr:hypothetical protein [Acidobacteriota bacterium]